MPLRQSTFVSIDPNARRTGWKSLSNQGQEIAKFSVATLSDYHDHDSRNEYQVCVATSLWKSDSMVAWTTQWAHEHPYLLTSTCLQAPRGLRPMPCRGGGSNSWVPDVMVRP